MTIEQGIYHICVDEPDFSQYLHPYELDFSQRLHSYELDFSPHPHLTRGLWEIFSPPS